MKPVLMCCVFVRDRQRGCVCVCDKLVKNEECISKELSFPDPHIHLVNVKRTRLFAAQRDGEQLIWI